MILCATCGKEIELKKQIASLKSQLAKCIESHDYRQHLIDTLYKQLANIKYLNAVKVEDIFYSMIKPHFIDNKFDDDNSLVSRDKFEEAIQAICKLAIDIDRDKIIEVLDEK
jgi:hypothetical protein